MSALRHPANDLDVIEDCWTPIGASARRSLKTINAARAEYRDADVQAQQEIEGGPHETSDVPGAGGEG